MFLVRVNYLLLLEEVFSSNLMSSLKLRILFNLKHGTCRPQYCKNLSCFLKSNVSFTKFSNCFERSLLHEEAAYSPSIYNTLERFEAELAIWNKKLTNKVQIKKRSDITVKDLQTVAWCSSVVVWCSDIYVFINRCGCICGIIDQSRMVVFRYTILMVI